MAKLPKMTIIIAKDATDAHEAGCVLSLVDKYYVTSTHWAKEFFTLVYANDYSGILYKEYWENPEFVEIFKIIYLHKLSRNGTEEAEKFIRAVSESYRGEKLYISFGSEDQIPAIILNGAG